MKTEFLEGELSAHIVRSSRLCLLSSWLECKISSYRFVYWIPSSPVWEGQGTIKWGEPCRRRWVAEGEAQAIRFCSSRLASCLSAVCFLTPTLGHGILPTETVYIPSYTVSQNKAFLPSIAACQIPAVREMANTVMGKHGDHQVKEMRAEEPGSKRKCWPTRSLKRRVCEKGAVWWLTLTGTKGKGKDPVGQPFSERDKSLSSSGWACRWFLLSNTTLEKELHAFSFSWRANTQGKSSVVTHSRRWPQVRLFQSLPNES